MLAPSAIFFIPMYQRNGLFTIPGFLENRNSHSCKTLFAVSMVIVGLAGGPIILYAGKLDAKMIGWAALILGVTVGAYAISGGLASVVYTDLLQALVLLIGGTFVVVLCIQEVDGLAQLLNQAPEEA